MQPFVTSPRRSLWSTADLFERIVITLSGERELALHILVFHSIRKTVATHFVNAQVPEGVTADILGDEKNTLTYGLYSGGASTDEA
jgi:hypothetical protein